MASKNYVLTQIAGIPDETVRRILTTVFEHVLDNLSLGAPEHQLRAVNLQAYYEQSTTASDTSEFSIAHGLNETPTYAIPILELDRPGAGLVPLIVSRAADSRRIYLKTTAGSTSVPITLLVEA